MSDPQERDIFTRRLSPRLASHAPNVNITILIVGRIMDMEYVSSGINRTVLSMTPSKHRRLIRKCER